MEIGGCHDPRGPSIARVVMRRGGEEARRRSALVSLIKLLFSHSLLTQPGPNPQSYPNSMS